MSYKVLITSGTGKNKTTSGSIALKSKEDVVRWVRKNPVGNYRTKTRVEDTSNKKVYTGQKVRFKTLGRW